MCVILVIPYDTLSSVQYIPVAKPGCRHEEFISQIRIPSTGNVLFLLFTSTFYIIIKKISWSCTFCVADIMSTSLWIGVALSCVYN